jgi:Exonuclease
MCDLRRCRRRAAFGAAVCIYAIETTSNISSATTLQSSHATSKDYCIRFRGNMSGTKSLCRTFEGVRQQFHRTELTPPVVLFFQQNGWVNEIIEFPLVIIDVATQKTEAAEFRTFVKPEINPKLTKFCNELTGIVQEEVDGGIALK